MPIFPKGISKIASPKFSETSYVDSFSFGTTH
jgi:hypothetical protein